MSQREGRNHHDYIHYYIYNGKPDGFFSAIADIHAYGEKCGQQQETYRCHQHTELRQFIRRMSFGEIEPLDISHAKQREEQYGKNVDHSDFSTQSDTSFFCTSTNPPRISSCCPSYSTTPFCSVEMMGAWSLRISNCPNVPGTLTISTWPANSILSGETILRLSIL